MNKIYLLFICCFISLASSAVTTYYPAVVSAPYGGTSQTICQNAANTATTVTYTVCSTVGAVGTLSVTATWYLNGLPVYTDPTPHAITGTTGSIALAAGKFTYSSFGSFTGTNGLYCALSWTGSSSVCNPLYDTVAGTTTNITVTESPTAITGTASVCTGDSSLLSNSVSGGIWSSSNTSVAGVNYSTGNIGGVAAGTSNITYQLGSGCYVTTVFTVNQTPATITGTFNVCSGSLNTLHDGTTGGTWTSSSTSIATIGSATGSLIAVSPGVTTISYTMASGCMTASNVTVNQLPATISGPTAVCSGDSVQVSDAVSGGVWTSSSPSIASVDFVTGFVSGIAASGSARISYTLSSGCYVTSLFTVNPIPAAISGTASVCVGSLTSLSDVTTTGTWSASNSNIVVGSGSGFVTGTGATAGLDTIYYTLATGCYNSRVVTVNPLPSVILGTNPVCAGSTTALTDSLTGGTWSSSTVSVATIVAATGVATGVASGLTTITYKLPTGCINTVSLSVNPLPSAISGATSICTGATTLLSDATTGGAWSSGSTSVATIGTSAVVSGLSAGTSTISYTLTATGCARSITLTVNPTPNAISGSGSVCVGTSTVLSDITTGGTWSSTVTAVATVNTSGVVSGISTGATTISYRVSTGCAAEFVVTVNPNPSSITGATHVCIGSTTSLSDVSTGGTWSSSAPAVATIDAFGNVSGVAAGTASISYTIATGCVTTKLITVNLLPAAISGANMLCAGATVTLSDATSGGTWSSTSTSHATVSGTGVVTGVSQSLDTINYTITATGCISSQILTINPLPGAITGASEVCIGSIISLSDTSIGGAWSSSNSKVSVDAAGNVTGVSVGSSTITYALAATGCLTKLNITINSLPASISGLTSVCVGSSVSVSDATSGGTWSSSDITLATVSSTGVITGTGAGVVTITYTLATGCISTSAITVNQVPSAITGTESVCVGLTTSLNASPSGGVWSSGTTSVASINFSTGVATGASAGVSNITYVLVTGCKVTAVLTVDPLPAAITGTSNVCVGSIITISDLTAGGTWTSSDPTIATIGAGTGIVTGISTGTVTMTYSLATGCERVVNISVNPLPVGIVGSSSVCIGYTTALTDPTPGGTWSSSTTSVATAGMSTGVVTGVSAGSTVITYSLSTGCDTTAVLTVDPLPSAISGPTTVCQGQNITLGDGAFVGTWVSGNTSVATIGATSGILTGVAAGTVTITFMLNSTGCYKTTTITVHQLPSAITGDTVICTSPTSGLADLTPGGTWSSSNTAIANINSSGLITPVAAGITTISYTLSTGCYNTATVTVNPVPSTISGSASVCAGSSTPLSDATTGGTWGSSNTTIANVDPATGIVTGVLPGSVTITYTLGTGCSATLPFAVNALPSGITGSTFTCVGATTVLHETATGGTWNSSNIAVAIVTGGSVQGVSAGTATISYVPATGCIVSTTVTVNSNPGPITGRQYVCTTDTVQLSDTATGGEWTSSHPGIASTGTLSGVVTGVSAGSATITYTLGTGCYTTTLVTVYTIPATITGPSNVCEGSTITLSDATPSGTWSSSQPIVAAVGLATGIVTGELVSGVDTIFYTTGGGACSASKIINVNQTPSVITGIFNVCTGNTSPLADSISGGTWTSSNSSIATVGISSGIVTGISGGVVNISYTLGTGCYMITPDTVNTTPSVITGPTNVCPGLSITLSDASVGGTWSSSDPSVAVVGGVSGIVTGTGSSGGSAVISYVISTTGCDVTTTINVNPAPPAISGSLVVCAGSSSILSDAAPGGIWTSSNPSSVPVGVTSGVVSGVSIGTATITYELTTTGCLTTDIVTVNPVPTAILGIANVCTGTTITLSDTTILGTWSSSNTSVASVGSITGIVYGVDSGYATISYTVGSGCYTTTLIRVNQSPNSISGVPAVCQGLNTTLTDTTPFGSWISSDTTVVAFIDPFTGNVTGVEPGTTTITYLLGTGCYVTQGVTVNALPDSIYGSPIVCVGASTFMSDATSGGVWSLTNNVYGSVDVSGDVTGITSGNDTVVYTLATGCLMTHFITVSAASSPVNGDSIVCVGSADTLTSATVGGLWTSSNVTIASVGSGTGYVTGVSAGMAIITYTTLAGCKAVDFITVNPVPAPITGIDNLCPGLTTTLFDVTGGGVWSSTDAAVATVNSGGTVSSILAGNTATISYTISDGCAAVVVFSVNPLPYIGAITGTTIFCMSSTSDLIDSVAGGIWSSTDTSIVSINSLGVATGVAVGTATISYKVTEQCGSDSTATIVQIKPLPYAGPIQGSQDLCLHFSSTLADSAAGGIWHTSDSAIASIDSLTGVAYGSNPGITTISYTYTNSCGSATATVQVTVNSTFAFAQIATLPDTPMCSKTMNQNFGALLPEPAGIVYHWSVSAGDTVLGVGADGQYSIISFNEPGRAVVTLSAEVLSSGCTVSDSFVTNISSSVSSQPGVQYYISEFACTDNTQDAYQWGYDDVMTLDSTLIIGETNQTYYNANPDTLHKNYWVMTTKGGCSQKSYYKFSTTTAVPNLAGNDLQISLFPNPADSRVNIEIKGANSSDVIKVDLLDMLGKNIQTISLMDGKGAFQVAALPSGVYSVMITNNGTKVGSKVFVKN